MILVILNMIVRKVLLQRYLLFLQQLFVQLNLKKYKINIDSIGI